MNEALKLQPSYSGELPIHIQREAILNAIQHNPVVVIAGETGSGKTTQIPKFLLEAGLGRRGLIGCTQPRRVAALSVAQRIAEELAVPFGHEVGAKIRFTDQTQKNTVIKVMTDGIFLNEIQTDPKLRAYEAIVIDEAHERSLNIDFILGFLRQLSEHRKNLKIIITSATIDTGTFSRAFKDAPIIEVSGRTYPVETFYCPIEELLENGDSLSYVEAAAKVIGDIITDNRVGDILAFLPSERDINSLRRELEDSPARTCDLLPLFGRLATVDQQRIFHPGGRRRIILATNIAETSLTVPGIRYVVDTGLARISRYSPSSRTQRLPIEPVAQSSADQRKGRCGRVSDGICYRLYSEQDYLARPRYTTPEIHRSNLASVILRMMAFRLGDIRTFPFVDPPGDAAIRGGYRLLDELNAIRRDVRNGNDDGYRLTELGRQLAQLPVDPTVARMLLTAREEGVTEAVLVIASALSIQDPRERPADLASEADAMHKRFVHKESDFLTLLNIWTTYHDEFDRLSQSQLRKFCKSHFLNFQRLREWRDIYQQLERILKKLSNSTKSRNSHKPANNPTPQKRLKAESSATPNEENYRAIHRAILSGLLSNIAIKEAAHEYRGTGNRKALLFPGSGLFDHEAAKKQRKAGYAKKAKPKPQKTSAPDWIVCGEWMETSRLFARTAAKIEVDWIEDLAGDLLKVSHSEAFWSSKAAAALCQQRKILFGLEISRSQVSYTRVDPAAATEIFIRNGLIEQGIREKPDFLTHNSKLLETAESEIVRRHLGSPLAAEDALFAFYHTKVQAAGSFPELRSFSKAYHGGQFDFLKAELSDLLPAAKADSSTSAFPKEVEIGGSRLPLIYRREPGSEDDGVALKIPITQFNAIHQSTLDWAIPGHREAMVECLLRGLPKPSRIRLHPLKERAAELAERVCPSERTLRQELDRILRKDFGILTSPAEWARIQLPDHLRLRIELISTKNKTLAQGRDLNTLRAEIDKAANDTAKAEGLEALPAWQRATCLYERENLSTWTFDDLPESIDLSGDAGLPLKAYPCLVRDRQGVHLRLVPDPTAAAQATAQAWPGLGEIAMGRELAWLRRDLKDLKKLGARLLPLGDFETVREATWSHILRHLFHTEHPLPLKQAVFQECLLQADTRRRGILVQLTKELEALLDLRHAVALIIEQKKTDRAIRFPGMARQLDTIAPADLLSRFEFHELPWISRYLRAMVLRAERAKTSVQRDIEKAAKVAPFEAELVTLLKQANSALNRDTIKPYIILLEEFKVSVYAQELGTAQKVSEKRLQALADSIREKIIRI